MMFSVPEVAQLASGGTLVRIPHEQDVPFTPRVRSLVDTAEFQRLHHVSQLGLVCRVYPGARHTRFEHALGVYHNTLRYLGQLATIPRFGSIIDRHQAEVLIVSSLLHDLGHWPFCHPIEDMSLPGLPSHEEYARTYLSGNSELACVLQQEWNIHPDEVLGLLCGSSVDGPSRLLRSILSGPVDVDKMDYLDRDSLHCGVPYGRHFDKHRLIHSLTLNERGDGLAISAKGKTAAELMVFARYVMFSEVYWHHAVRAATSMFARCFFEMSRNADVAPLLLATEPQMISALLDASRGRSWEVLATGIFGPKRLLYKRVAEFSHAQDRNLFDLLARRPYVQLVEISRRLAQLLSHELGQTISDVDLLIDAPPPHREIEFRVDVFDHKKNEYRPLTTVSPVVEALATRQFDDYVKKVRIFVHPRLKLALTTCSDINSLIREAQNDVVAARK